MYYHFYSPVPFKSAINIWFFALLLVLTTGCSKDQKDDLERPQIHFVNTIPEKTSAEICEAQSNHVLQINTGGVLEITVRFTDDVELGSAKFDLHHNFDCHGHKSTEKTTIWNVIEIIELSGTEQTITRTFQSPDNVRPGLYHLGVMALDAIGREAEMRFFDVVVRDPSDTIAPIINLLSPEDGHIHTRESQLIIEGSILDETELGTGGFEISMISPQGQVLSVARGNFPEGHGVEGFFEEAYNIPGFVQAGICTLRIAAYDWRNNTAVVQRTFELID